MTPTLQSPLSPVIIHLDPTTVCNLRCVHCYQSRYEVEPKHVPVEEVMDIVRLVGDVPFQLNLTGTGDLFMHPEWRHILALLSETQVHVTVSTNLLSVREEDIDTIWSNDCVKLINVSVDAANAASYRRIRGGNWERLIRQIRHASEHPLRKGLRASMSVMKSTLEEVVDFCRGAVALGLDGVVFQKTYNFPNLPELEGFDGKAEEDIDLDRWREVLREGCRHLVAAGAFVRLTLLPEDDSDVFREANANNTRVTRFLQPVVDRMNQIQRALKYPACISPWTELFRSRDGSWRSCCKQKHETTYGVPMGNVTDAWHSADLQRVRDQISDHQRPGSCRADVCGIARELKPLNEAAIEV